MNMTTRHLTDAGAKAEEAAEAGKSAVDGLDSCIFDMEDELENS